MCLGPDGAAGHIIRVVKMIQSRWKLPILFRLYAVPAMRTSELLQDMPDVSQKMLTQHLRELEADRLLERVCVSARPLHVEYRLSPIGRRLLLALEDIRSFSVDLGFNEILDQDFSS